MIPNFLNGRTPFVIAEIGSNWSTLEDCLYSIRCAQVSGADAVKFQLYDPYAMYGSHEILRQNDIWLNDLHKALPEPGWGKPDPYVMSGQLNPAWLPQLKAEADSVGIEFMCSAFSPELCDVVNRFVNIHKVASAEMCHLRILERMRSYGKPVILSTGAHPLVEIEHAVGILQNMTYRVGTAYDNHLVSKDEWKKALPENRWTDKPLEVVLMYCVAAYPARLVRLDNIPYLQNHFGLPVGYSDHTTDIREIPTLAVRRGACVIEKHVNFVGTKGPDSPHSLDTDEFRIMINAVRGTHQMDGYLSHGRDEMGMLTRHHRRLIATRDIEAGHMLKENENFGIFRSLKDETHAYSPFMINEVNGKIAKVDIEAGNGIGPGDF